MSCVVSSINPQEVDKREAHCIGPRVFKYQADPQPSQERAIIDGERCPERRVRKRRVTAVSMQNAERINYDLLGTVLFICITTVNPLLPTLVYPDSSVGVSLPFIFKSILNYEEEDSLPCPFSR